MKNKQQKSMTGTALFCLLVFCLPVICAANVITVPSDGIKTITEAVSKAKTGDTIVVQPGIYKEHIQLTSGITLISKEIFKAVIDGKSRGDVVTISQKCTIFGFEVRSGNMGIVTRGPEASVQSCKINNNRGSGILCTGNLPVIENNIIVYNQGSGIQALDIATGATKIARNTIAYNGNNGIAFSGTAALTIENNIIVFNAGSGTKVNPENKKVVIVNNDFCQNGSFMTVIPGNNFSFDPLFKAPKRRTMDFSLQQNSQAINKTSDGKNLGALVVF